MDAGREVFFQGYFTNDDDAAWHPWALSCMVGSDVSSLSHLSVVMVQPGQDRNGNHLGSFVRSGTR